MLKLLRSKYYHLRRVFLGLLMTLVSTSNLTAGTSYQHVDENGNINQVNMGVNSQKNIYSGSNLSKEPIESYQVSIRDFKKLIINIPATVIYKKGPPAIKVSAQPHVFKKITIKEVDGVLTISSGNYSTNKPVILELSSYELHRASIFSTADVRLNHIGSPSFNLDVRGASSVSAYGEANNCRLLSQGSTDIDLSNLHCKTLSLETEGSADVQVYVAKSIKGKLEGAIDLSIAGNPALRQLEASGAVDVVYE